MSFNLIDWLGDNSWSWWLTLALLFIGVGVLTRSRWGATLAAAATAAAAAGAFSMLGGRAVQIAVPAAVFVVAAVVLCLVVKPWRYRSGSPIQPPESQPDLTDQQHLTGEGQRTGSPRRDAPRGTSVAERARQEGQQPVRPEAESATSTPAAPATPARPPAERMTAGPHRSTPDQPSARTHTSDESSPDQATPDQTGWYRPEQAEPGGQGAGAHRPASRGESDQGWALEPLPEDSPTVARHSWTAADLDQEPPPARRAAGFVDEDATWTRPSRGMGWADEDEPSEPDDSNTGGGWTVAVDTQGNSATDRFVAPSRADLRRPRPARAAPPEKNPANTPTPPNHATPRRAL